LGGNDSVRILPFLDKKVITDNPKILMGYSDISTLHVFLNLQGVVTFYGPVIMAGFSQMDSLPKNFKSHVREILFEPRESYEYQAYKEYCDGYPDWSNKDNLGKVNTMKSNDGWHWLQGKEKAQGVLFGGCIEVLEMMKATDFWPSQDFWQGKIFFLKLQRKSHLFTTLTMF
jgi:muramoyltetrapeptide carboxypeptidase LdcA involved in peptidoglycan recycling